MSLTIEKTLFKDISSSLRAIADVFTSIPVKEGTIYDEVEIAKNDDSSKQLLLSSCRTLIKFEPNQTSVMPYPLGSIVFYQHNGIVACGIVKSIYLDCRRPRPRLQIYYKIKNSFEFGDSDTINMVSEDNLFCFGAGCPVRVKMNSASSAMDQEELDGQVLHSKVDHTVVYTVLLFCGNEKGGFKIEENVVQERIRYREISAFYEVNSKPSAQFIDHNQSFSKLATAPKPEVKDGAIEELSSCPNLDHTSNSIKSSGSKRAGSPLKEDDEKRSRPSSRDDVSKSIKGNGCQVDPKVRPKCDEAENKKNRTPFHMKDGVKRSMSSSSHDGGKSVQGNLKVKDGANEYLPSCSHLDATSNSRISPGKNRAGAPLKEDEKKSRQSQPDDVSTSVKVNGYQIDLIAQPKCDAAENKKNQTPFHVKDDVKRSMSSSSDDGGKSIQGNDRRVDSKAKSTCNVIKNKKNYQQFRLCIPTSAVKQDRESQVKLYEHIVNDKTLRNSGFRIEPKGRGDKMYLSAFAARHNLDMIKKMIEHTLHDFTGEDYSDQILELEMKKDAQAAE